MQVVPRQQACCLAALLQVTVDSLSGTLLAEPRNIWLLGLPAIRRDLPRRSASAAVVVLITFLVRLELTRDSR